MCGRLQRFPCTPRRGTLTGADTCPRDSRERERRGRDSTTPVESGHPRLWRDVRGYDVSKPQGGERRSTPMPFWRQPARSRCFLPTLGIRQVQRIERFDHRRADHDAREPFVVCGDDIPRRIVGGGVADHLLVRGHVFVPVCPFRRVVGGKLPVALGLVEPREKTFPLLLELRDPHFGRIRLIGLSCVTFSCCRAANGYLRASLLGRCLLARATSARLRTDAQRSATNARLLRGR